MPRVLLESLITRRRPGAFRAVLEAAGFAIVVPAEEGVIPEARMVDYLEGVDAVIMGVGPFSAATMDRAPGLRAIARTGVGYERIDLDAATARRVAVTITPGANHDGVAEHTMALILALARDLRHHDRNLRAGRWDRSRLPTPVRGRTLGLVGMGRIGRAVAGRARAFGMTVLAAAPRPRPAEGVEFVPLDELLARADVVSLHCPLTPETRGLFGREAFAKMKPGAHLINTSRGGLVVEADLVEALRSGRVGAAGLDVFDAEPPPADHPFWGLDNVLAAPHMAGVDAASVDAMALQAAENVVALYRGDWPGDAVVNPEVRPGWAW